MSHPHWWDELAATVEANGHDRHSAGWYAAMRDAYAERFPNADLRSKENMRLLAEWAAAKAANQSCPVCGRSTQPVIHSCRGATLPKAV